MIRTALFQAVTEAQHPSILWLLLLQYTGSYFKCSFAWCLQRRGMQICPWRSRCFLGHDENYLETCSQIYKLGTGWETHLNVFVPQERSKNDNGWPCHIISILFSSRTGVETRTSDPKSHSGRYRDRIKTEFKHGCSAVPIYTMQENKA